MKHEKSQPRRVFSHLIVLYTPGLYDFTNERIIEAVLTSIRTKDGTPIGSFVTPQTRISVSRNRGPSKANDPYLIAATVSRQVGPDALERVEYFDITGEINGVAVGVWAQPATT